MPESLPSKSPMTMVDEDTELRQRKGADAESHHTPTTAGGNNEVQTQEALEEDMEIREEDLADVMAKARKKRNKRIYRNTAWRIFAFTIMIGGILLYRKVEEWWRVRPMCDF